MRLGSSGSVKWGLKIDLITNVYKLKINVRVGWLDKVVFFFLYKYFVVF